MVIEQSSDSRVRWVTTSERLPLKRLTDLPRTPSHSRRNAMPMIDVYAAAGAFGDKALLDRTELNELGLKLDNPGDFADE